MRLGVISDIHGVALALRAMLDDGDHVGVDRWWVLGDLVLFGPGPVEVLEMLDGLAEKVFVAGTTDRYVLTDDQPHPHTIPEDAVGDVDLVRRYGLMAAGAAWTRGVLDQAGVLGLLDGLPDRQQMVLEDGTELLGVHASPAADDGPGFDTTSSDANIRSLLASVDAEWVVGGHTHDPTDRQVDGIRLLNPGSVGLPRALGSASWMLIDHSAAGTVVEHRTPSSTSPAWWRPSIADVTPIASSSHPYSREAPSSRPTDHRKALGNEPPKVTRWAPEDGTSAALANHVW